MNKRISKKLAKMATVRDFTLQEAWDRIAEHLTTNYDNACYFINDMHTGRLDIHSAYGKEPILIASKLFNRHVKWEPEDVTFYCKECGDEMNAQTDIANEGLCDPCNEGQKEMWAAEQKHEEYEYRNMKL